MTKQKHFFILGNNPALSLAEIVAVLGVGDKEVIFGKDFLIIELDNEINAEELMKILGGTIKIGIVDKVETKDVAFLQAKDLIKNLNINKLLITPESLVKGSRRSTQSKKFYFGFSIYGNLKIQIRKLGMAVKNELKKDLISSRWVVGQGEQFSSVIVKKNKLISEQGVEWCILKNQDTVYIGRTLAVQEFESYGRRDYGRPARDPRSGMIPPKLAMMMINIALGAGAKPPIGGLAPLALLDPFCGSGTILQEAAVLGIGKIIGSDLSKKAVGDAEKNLKWLMTKGVRHPIGCRTPIDHISIFQADVKQLSKQLKGAKPVRGGLAPSSQVDLIVTEPYLGPPQHGNESRQVIDVVINELSELYLAAFREFKKVLKKDGAVCMVWPVFVRHDKIKFLPIIKEVENFGFEKIDVLKNFNKKNPALNLSERGTIVYGRQGQKVRREILLFELASE